MGFYKKESGSKQQVKLESVVKPGKGEKMENLAGSPSMVNAAWRAVFCFPPLFLFMDI